MKQISRNEFQKMNAYQQELMKRLEELGEATIEQPTQQTLWQKLFGTG